MNLPVKKKFVNRLRFDRIVVMSLWPRFLAHPVYLCVRMNISLCRARLKVQRAEPRVTETEIRVRILASRTSPSTPAAKFPRIFNTYD